MRISIYAFWFPPDPDVGARRWGQIAQDLASSGHSVVITTRHDSLKADFVKRRSEFSGIELRSIKTHTFPQPFGKSFVAKIAWHLTKLSLRLRYKGWYYDPSIRLKNQLKRLVEDDIATGVDAIIVTCAPFRWSQHIGSFLHGRKIKPRYFIDLRDPWTSNQLAYFTSLSNKRLKQEAAIEKEAILAADGIILVAPEMSASYPNSKTLFLPNNIVIPKGTWRRPEISSEIRLIFPGTLYQGGQKALSEFLSDLQAALPEHTIRFFTMGNWNPAHLDLIAENCQVQHLGYLTKEEVTREINLSHFVISYVSPKLPFAINTKIIEAIENERPVICIGEISFNDFITKNNIGWHFNGQSSDEIRKEVLSRKIYGPFVSDEFDRTKALERLVRFIGNRNEAEA